MPFVVLLLSLAPSEAALAQHAQPALRVRSRQGFLGPARYPVACAKMPTEAKSKVNLQWLTSPFRAKEPGWWTSLSKAGS